MNTKAPRAWIEKERVTKEVDTLVWAGGKLQVLRCTDGQTYNPYKEATLLYPTGLQDKNGTEGYKHDICRFKDDANQDHIGTIEWVGSGWYLVSVENDDEGNYQFELSSREFEIIGNIHQHPDLLKKE